MPWALPNRESGILPAHEIVGYSVAARDGMYVYINIELAAGENLQFFPWRVEGSNRAVEVEKDGFTYIFEHRVSDYGRM